jgi:hypothetical protein
MRHGTEGVGGGGATLPRLAPTSGEQPRAVTSRHRVAFEGWPYISLETASLSDSSDQERSRLLSVTSPGMLGSRTF